MSHKSLSLTVVSTTAASESSGCHCMMRARKPSKLQFGRLSSSRCSGATASCTLGFFVGRDNAAGLLRFSGEKEGPVSKPMAMAERAVRGGVPTKDHSDSLMGKSSWLRKVLSKFGTFVLVLYGISTVIKAANTAPAHGTDQESPYRSAGFHW